MTRKSALKLIKNGEPISLEYVTADVSRKTGGKLKIEPHLKLSKSSHDRKAAGTVTFKTPQQKNITVHTNLIFKVNGQRVN